MWMGISSALIILNKHLMSTDGFHYPMALSGLGMSFSSVASWLCCRVRTAAFTWLHLTRAYALRHVFGTTLR